MQNLLSTCSEEESKVSNGIEYLSTLTSALGDGINVLGRKAVHAKRKRTKETKSKSKKKPKNQSSSSEECDSESSSEFEA